MATLSARWIHRSVIAFAILMMLAFAVGSLARGRGRTGAEGPQSKPGARPAALQAEQRSDVAQDDVAQDQVGAGELGPASAPGSVSSTLPGLGDRIVRTADLTVEVRRDRFEDAWDEASRIASRFGGQVVSTTRGDGNIPVEDRDRTLNGDISIRVPSAKFENATIALRALGKVRSESASSEDVTQEFVDLQSRLRHLRAEETVLMRLFARAKTVGEALSVQTRLSEIQGQIEEITGRIKFLDARTSFSTINLHLGEPGAALLHRFEEESPSLAQAWKTAVDGLVRIAGAAMILAVWLAPFGLLALLGLAVYRKTRPAAA